MTRSIINALAPTTRCRCSGLAAIVLAAFAFAPQAQGQLPTSQLSTVSPPGGQQATVVDVVVAGIDLDGAGALLFSHPGITATPKLAPLQPFQTQPDPLPGQFTVTIAPETPPGVYDVRASGTFGLSNPRAFMVGDRPEVREQAGNNTQDKALPLELGTLVNGQSDGAAPDWYKLTGAAGQRLLVDCWAQRIDSRMDPTLVLYDMTGRELARSRDVNRRDPLLDATLPAAGEYLLKVHDFVYAGSAEHFYRLTAMTAPYVDFILPPAGLPGTKALYTLYGRNLPGGVAADGLTIGGRPLEKLAVEIELPAVPVVERRTAGGLVRPEDASLDGVEYRLPSPQGASNPTFIGFATAPVVLEQEPNDVSAQANVATVPCEFVGHFGPRGDQDWLAFEAKQGDVFWIETLSQRLGQATDPSVLLQRVTKNDKGEEQSADVADLDDDPKNIGGFAFNTATDDPSYRFAVPEAGLYRVMLRDNYYGASGDRLPLYRLSIRREQPDFRLAAIAPFEGNLRAEARPWSSLLRRGGTQVMDVFAYRRDGFTGPIAVHAEGLPDGVICAPATIASGLDTVTLVFSATEQAAPWAGLIKIVGVAKVGDQELTREARGGAVLFAAGPNLPAQARMTQGIGLAVSTDETAPFLIEVGAGKPWETSLAGKLEIPVKVTRRGEIKAALTLTPIGLPPNVAPQPLALDANTNEGNLVLQVAANAPLGDFTFYLQAQTTLGYRRDPVAADKAAAIKAELEKLAADLTTAAQTADAAKVAADKAAVDAAAALQQADTAKQAADQAAVTAVEEAKVAAEAAAAAKTAADNDANNVDLANAYKAAEQASVDAAAKSKTATEAQVAATKVAADAAAANTAATEAKAKAEVAATEAAAQAKAATDAKTAAEQKATALATAAAPKDLNVFLPSTSVPLKITSSPVALTTAAPSFTVKAGQPLELPVAVNRLYGFADAVQLELVPPGGLAGVKAAAVPVPAGQAEGKFLLETTADATPGSHVLTVKATAAFNGQNLSTTYTVTLVVEK